MFGEINTGDVSTFDWLIAGDGDFQESYRLRWYILMAAFHSHDGSPTISASLSDGCSGYFSFLDYRFFCFSLIVSPSSPHESIAILFIYIIQYYWPGKCFRSLLREKAMRILFSPPPMILHFKSLCFAYAERKVSFQDDDNRYWWATDGFIYLYAHYGATPLPARVVIRFYINSDTTRMRLRRRWIMNYVELPHISWKSQILFRSRAEIRFRMTCFIFTGRRCHLLPPKSHHAPRRHF